MLNALDRCGDVHSPYERTTLFIEGLTLAIKPLILQTREDRPLSSFEDTVDHARSHGEALRAQKASGRRVDFARPRPVKQVFAALDSVPSSTTGPTASYQTAAGAVNHLAMEGDHVGGMPSLSTEDSSCNDGDSLFYGDRRRPYKPARDRTVGPRGPPSGVRPEITRNICEDPGPRGSFASLVTRSGTI